MSEPIPYYDDSAMRAYLLQCVDYVGGQRALARRLNISQREISQAVNGRRPVSARIARALGFARMVRPRQVIYRQVPQPQPAG